VSTRLLRAFLEACHAGPSDLTRWSSAVLETMTPLVAPDHGLLLGASDRDKGDHGYVCARGRVERLLDVAPSFLARDGRPADDAERRRQVAVAYRPFRVALAGAHAAKLGVDLRPTIARAMPGFDDVLGMFAGAGRVALVACTPLGKGDAKRARDPRLLRVQRHFAGAAGARLEPSTTSADLVLDGRGRAVFATRRGETLRPAMIDMARAFARELAFRDEVDPDAERLWDALWSGGWSVTHTETEAGRRLLVLRRASPESAPRLTAREREVLARARRGESLKTIALELGRSVATVSIQLARGLAKLGLTDRTQLVSLDG